MKIGILIPTFNRRDYLKQTLDSVLSQSYRDLEVIVIDNGSSDGTPAFMATLTDSRVRYIVNEINLGMIGSINKGITFFSKQVAWCSILSDDDMLDVHCIEHLVSTSLRSQSKSIVRSNLSFIDEAGRTIRTARRSPLEETALDYFDRRSRGIRETYLAGVLFKREAFQRIGGYPQFPTGLGSDDAIIFALSLLDRLIFEPRAVASIRIHEAAESRSGSDGIRKLETIREFLDYCRTAAGTYACFTPEQQRRLEHIIKRYRINLNTYWWRSAVHAALDRDGDSARTELDDLRFRVLDDGASFSCRARISTAVWNRMRINPETFRICRAAGRAIDYVQFVLRNRLP